MHLGGLLAFVISVAVVSSAAAQSQTLTLALGDYSLATSQEGAGFVRVRLSGPYAECPQIRIVQGGRFIEPRTDFGTRTWAAGAEWAVIAPADEVRAALAAGAMGIKLCGVTLVITTEQQVELAYALSLWAKGGTTVDRSFAPVPVYGATPPSVVPPAAPRQRSRRARPAPAVRPVVYRAPPPQSYGGTVQVRGYTRRDGTYVRGYTRRR